jgi:hypothetical protein
MSESWRRKIEKERRDILEFMTNIVDCDILDCICIHLLG